MEERREDEEGRGRWTQLDAVRWKCPLLLCPNLDRKNDARHFFFLSSLSLTFPMTDDWLIVDSRY